MPFLENVTRGRNVPRERLEEVAAALRALRRREPDQRPEPRADRGARARARRSTAIDLPIYFGNRNWHPFLEDTLREMRSDGVTRALAFFTSGLQLLLELPPVPREHRRRADRGRARRTRGAAPARVLQPPRLRRGERGARRSVGARRRLPGAHVVFTAHWIPTAMAARSRYETQLAETARLVAERVGVARPRSRLPEPQRVAAGAVARARRLRPHPLAAGAGRAGRRRVAGRLRLRPHGGAVRPRRRGAGGGGRRRASGSSRASTAGTHPAFVAMIRELIQERLDPDVPRRALGRFGPSHDICLAGCCLPG